MLFITITVPSYAFDGGFTIAESVVVSANASETDDYASEKLHDALKEMNILVFSEGARSELSDCELLYLYRDIYKWTELYEEWFGDILNPYVIGLYNFSGAIYNWFN